MEQIDNRLMNELIKLYRLSSSKSEFQTRVASMTDDPKLVQWATEKLFGTSNTGETSGY